MYWQVKNSKFGIQNGLNVARAGYTEDQILLLANLLIELDMILFSIWTTQMSHNGKMQLF